MRPGRSLEASVQVGPGRFRVKVVSDVAVLAALGEDEPKQPSREHQLDGYASKRAKRVLVVQNAGTKTKARGSYEVNCG